jgi:hypothetical protein
MKALLIEPLEPLVLSKKPVASQEFITGSHAVLPIPSPTTISGLVGSALNVTLESQANADHISLLRKLIEGLEEKGGCGKPVIKGPLLWFKDLSNEPYVCLGSIYAPLREIRVEQGSRNIKVYLSKADHGKYVKPVVEERIGVKLVKGYGNRTEKVVDKGYTYKYSTLSYRVVGSGDSVIPTFIYLYNCDKELEPGAYRVGGEGRIASVNVTKLEALPEEIAKTLELIESPLTLQNKGLHLTLTPTPLIPLALKELNTLTLDESKPNVIGLEFVERVEGSIQADPEELEPGGKLKRKIERLNLGYSEVLSSRRPQILALPTGTIIRTKKPERYADTIETLWSLGFASLLRLNGFRTP